MKPILLSPVGKEYLWGGTRLRKEYNKQIDMTPLAETWECSTHSDGMSIVRTGKYKNMPLYDVLKKHPEYIGNKNYNEFPVIIKLIDAEKKLSVQVHPDDEYARIYENQNGKTEMWYVLDAKPEANLICGFSHDMTPEILRNAVETGTLDEHLQKFSVKKGDVFFIPAGTVHAIGEGVLVAEIQQNSDVTYRIYDYNRVDKNGHKRELHFDKALKVLDMKKGKETIQKTRRTDYFSGYTREVLCNCKYFMTEFLEIDSECIFTVNETSFQVLLCTDGNGEIKTDSKNSSVNFRKGDCIFIPARSGKCCIKGKTSVLKVSC